MTHFAQTQALISVNKQDVIQRQSFDHLVRDVITSIRDYEKELEKCNKNNCNDKMLKKIRSKNIQAAGSINCLASTIKDIKKDKKAIKMAINRIVPYYLHLRNCDNQMVKAQVLPLIIFIVNMFKTLKGEMLPPIKLKNFNEMLVSKNLKNLVSSRNEIEQDLEYISKNYLEFNKKQNLSTNKNNPKMNKNLKIFDNIKYSSNDINTNRIYGNVNRNDIDYDFDKNYEKDQQRQLEDEITGWYDENDNVINGINHGSYYDLKDCQNIRKNEKIDFQLKNLLWIQAQVAGHKNSKFLVIYRNPNNDRLEEIVNEDDAMSRFAKLGSFTNLKQNRLRNIQMNQKILIDPSYLGIKNTNKKICAFSRGVLKGQVKFQFKWNDKIYTRYIHANDTRIQFA